MDEADQAAQLAPVVQTYVVCQDHTGAHSCPAILAKNQLKRRGYPAEASAGKVFTAAPAQVVNWIIEALRKEVPGK